ncbi:putative pyruvoyl tetrahydrobiopterin synthase [Coemansia reversa NRRL 1564]|uniref:6-pyruvoyltetrahydropterin synthase n=1 Tax=Coemansia reversa (strain ATCC 12441 / NRRL 1564) TaxID=763665 RepID=A0A2G5B9H9_COERN|nr:putative pyruvoyl tetrahydrobiopterin synthase [Coemansia reversa NRRL 1564]|eukprot:PIA15640.1 putative pyruvoyl tetrahydrobiopterin synthase [Coemansia reversa NRRL 1564]
MPLVACVSRTEHFSAAHRLHSPYLSVEENRRIFGKCNHASGHGHNYVLETILRGPVDERTGMVVNIDDLKRWIKSAVLDVVDHRNLDVDVSYFEQHPSTTENLAAFIWIRLAQTIPHGLLHQIVLSETPKNKVIYTGEGLTDSDLSSCVV